MAAGGWDDVDLSKSLDYFVYIFDRASGEMLRRSLKGDVAQADVTAVVNRMARVSIARLKQ